MTTDLHQKKLLTYLLISLVFHLVTLKLLEYLPKSFFSSHSSSIQEKNTPLKIRSITRSELKKYRTVGVKNGKKDFSIPINTPSRPSQKRKQKKKNIVVKAKKEKLSPKKRAQSKKKKSLSLNSLRIKEQDLGGIKLLDPKMEKLEIKKLEKNKFEITAKSSIRHERARIAQTDILKQLAVVPNNAKILRKTGFSMQLEPPAGVTEDELNSMEKIYYSFQKRTFRAYVNSFLKTYKQSLIEHPSIKTTLQSDVHRLTARVLFDLNGNIISIKIIRSSQSDEVHNLFEETLKEIRKLPNPPKDLIQDNRYFTIYYQLKIN